MAIVYHEDWTIQKGVKDAKRHQEKIDEAIRKNVRNVIGEESIITNEGKTKVRVPVRGLKDYRFIYGSPKVGGVGQGEGGPGDILGQRPVGQGKGGGDGEGYMEAEVDVDYLLDVMFEDLGLPWLDPKKKNSIEIPKGWKFESISKKGVHSRIHKKRTMIEAIKRNVILTSAIVNETKCSQEDAEKALIQAKGDINEAILIIKEERLDDNSVGHIIIDDDSIRYKQIEEDTEICSKAVVIAMMDVSGSMTPDKKYLCRSLLFWLVQFLKKQYEQVEIRFIQHTESAIEVDEDTFFKHSTTGGTLAHTAFDKANYMIDTEYPLDEWNIYCVYCSDGEDWEPKMTIDSMKIMLSKKINMMSYIEIKPFHDLFDEAIQYQYGYSTLLPECQREWDFKETDLGGEGKFWINKELHFLLSVVKDKSHIWPCLKHMLGLNTVNTVERAG